MPNWCENEVSIQTVTVEEAEAFMESIKDGDNHFSFNKILPMPKELKGTKAPATIVSQKEYDEFKLTESERNMGMGTPITQEMSDNFKEKYGYDTWYDWAIANWGTKWAVSCEDSDISGNTLLYDFLTAWCPPTGIHEALVAQHPNWRIKWSYREEDMDEQGTLT